MGQQTPSIAEERAVIINRDYLRWIEVPGRHTVVDNGAGGWRLDVDQPTRIVVHFDHSVVRLDLDADDYVLASGDEVYVSIAAPPGDGKGAATA